MKLHAPGQVGGASPQLPVDKIADPTEEQTWRNQRGDEVGDDEEGATASASKQPHCDEDPEQSAVEGHASLPDSAQHQRVLEPRLETIKDERFHCIRQIHLS